MTDWFSKRGVDVIGLTVHFDFACKWGMHIEKFLVHWSNEGQRDILV